MSKILIVEDNVMIADMIEDILIRAGYEVCGIASTVRDAVALVQCHRPHLILLDLRLENDELGTEIAARLAPWGQLGILYATGNRSEVALTARDGHACLAKPYLSKDLLRALEIVAEILAIGTASPPHPPGFQILQPPTPALPAQVR